MKKIATLLLLLAALPAWSQVWLPYAQTDSATLYFDSLRTRKMGDTAFVWDLHDLKAEAKDGSGRAYRAACAIPQAPHAPAAWQAAPGSRVKVRSDAN